MNGKKIKLTFNEQLNSDVPKKRHFINDLTDLHVLSAHLVVVWCDPLLNQPSFDKGCFVTAEALNMARQQQHLHIVFCPSLSPGTGKPVSLHMTDLKLAGVSAISETQKHKNTKTTTFLPGRAVVWNHHTSTMTPKRFRCCASANLTIPFCIPSYSEAKNNGDCPCFEAQASKSPVQHPGRLWDSRLGVSNSVSHVIST